MATYEKLKTINDSLSSIKTSVTNKGSTPSGNITTYATAISNLPTPMPVINREVVNGVYGMPTTSFTFSLPSDATDLGNYALQYAFYNCIGLTSVDLSSLTTVSGSQALSKTFQICTGLTSVDLSSLATVSGSSALGNAFNGCTGLIGTLDLNSLTTVSGSSALGNAFNGCTGLTSVDLSSLTTVSGSSALYSTFTGCTGLTSVDLSSLTTIGVDSSSSNNGQFSSCFNNCNSLVSLSFPNLEKIYCTGSSTGNGTFANNNKVQKMYFPKLDTITYGSGASSSNQNACKNVFYGCSSLTELHFGAANQTAIEASPGYSTAWGRGAGNVTIYFDL